MEITAPLWTPFKKWLYLILMIYLFLYMFPFPVDNIFGDSFITNWYVKGIDAIVLLAGKNLFGITQLEKMDSGSGDTTFDYIRIATFMIMALPASGIVFFFTRRQKNYVKAWNWLMVYARYFVGLFMIMYGFFKLFEVQFFFPRLATLDETYGDSSPMKLLWTFMGYSRTYTVTTGGIEVVAGLLLLFRKTTTLGAILSAIAMMNVALLNFCYDVPVKLFSTHLLLISLIILAPDLKKIYNFFIRHQATTLTASKVYLPKRWMRIARLIIKPIIIAAIPVMTAIDQLDPEQDEAMTRNAALSGVYTTDVFICNKDTLPVSLADTMRWNKLIIEGETAKITTMANGSAYFEVAVDTVAKKLTITSDDDSTEKYSFTYTFLPNNYFSIAGLYEKDSIAATFKRKTKNEYRLVKRGFHWINEYPYNH